MTVHSYLRLFSHQLKSHHILPAVWVQTSENSSLGTTGKKKRGPHAEPKPPTFNGRQREKKPKRKQSLRFYVYSEIQNREVPLKYKYVYYILAYYSYIRCHLLGSLGQRYSFLGLFPKSMCEVFFGWFFFNSTNKWFF